jgi:ribonuclease Y
VSPDRLIGWIPLVLGAVAGAALLAVSAWAARKRMREARAAATRIVAEAHHEGDSRAKEILVGAQERAIALEEEVERKDRDLDTREAALDGRTRRVEREASELGRQRQDLDRRLAAVAQAETAVEQAEGEVRAAVAASRASLERIAGLTAAQARSELVVGIEEEARKEGARIARRIEDEARETASRDAVALLVHATQRMELREVMESTVSFVQLPNDDMKGRIIGREGRNIRAIEMATGIDLIVDDTPHAILLSCFDPVRREVARIAVERLIEDGRIHPARIEEVVAKVRTEVETLIEETGAAAAFNLGITDLHPRLAKLVGRMRYRTHHGHNLLAHAGEVALIAGHMADELGARSPVARRAGLLHEIGRVEETAVGHPTLASAELAGKYGESDEVVHAVQSLHPEVEAKSLEALLLATANRISDHRPGARKDNLEIFIERLRRLEVLSASFAGVAQAFAVKAGKEVRVIVDAKTTTDEDAYALSKQIARKLERELAYPGQIKVSVVRETRAVQFAV